MTIKSRLMILFFLIFFALPAGALLAAQSKHGWEAEWDKTVQAAKKEGKLTIYISEVYEEVFREFEKKYPEIKVLAVPALAGQLAQRIMSERRAGKYLADLYLSGSDTVYNVFYKGNMLDPIKPALILPEVLDESKWFGNRHIYVDEKGQYIFAFNGITQTYFYYNTKLVTPKEFKSYWDFVNPKWKGKIIILEPGISGTGAVLRFLYNNPGIGPKFLRQFLDEMQLTSTRDRRQLVDWLATGKFPIAGLQPYIADIHKAKEQGLPVGWFDPGAFKEGAPLATAAGNIALFNQAPHPNAAKLAINWVLSREGQTVIQEIGRDKDSLRTDIPKETVLAHVRRVEGTLYMMLENPEWRDMTPALKLVEEIWKKRK